MPRVDLPVQEYNSWNGENEVAGVAGDATNDHEFTNDGRTCVRVKNTGGTICNVTIPMVADAHGRTGNKAAAVPATTGDMVFGPFDPNVFNGGGTPAAAGGKVAIDIDNATGVTLKAFKISEKGS